MIADGAVGVIGVVHHVEHDIREGVVVVHDAMIFVHVLDEGIEDIFFDMVVNFEEQTQHSILLEANFISHVGAVGFIPGIELEFWEVMGFVDVVVFSHHHLGVVEVAILLRLHFCLIWHEPLMHQMHL